MAKRLKYRSEISEAVHSSASAMHRIGAIDEAAMREFDESCLVPAPFKPREIRKIRQGLKVSQPVFARYLNASETTVRRWESGTQKPGGIAIALLRLVQKHGLQILA